MKKLFLLLTVSIPSLSCIGQTLARTVIGSQGDYYSTPKVSVSWTVGEVMSETYATPNHFLTQGFQQPDYNKPSNPEVNFDFFNGFSPNGDGINDTWTIPFLVNYVKNTVVIINRWGNEVWKGNNYDNRNIVFRGNNMNGNELPDGTYFYIIQYNNLEKRGWVFIKR
jgi:gliding motility-associated-like protein